MIITDGMNSIAFRRLKPIASAATAFGFRHIAHLDDLFIDGLVHVYASSLIDDYLSWLDCAAGAYG